jgi:hypothetical protein
MIFSLAQPMVWDCLLLGYYYWDYLIVGIFGTSHIIFSQRYYGNHCMQFTVRQKRHLMLLWQPELLFTVGLKDLKALLTA